MYILTALYLATYAFSAYKVLKLSQVAISQTHVASLKALNIYVDQLDPSEYSDRLYEKLYGELELLYRAVLVGAKKTCVLNMLYLCPMVLLFFIMDGDGFAKSYVSEYKSEIVPELRIALREIGLSNAHIDKIISMTSSHLKTEESSS